MDIGNFPLQCASPELFRRELPVSIGEDLIYIRKRLATIEANVVEKPKTSEPDKVLYHVRLSEPGLDCLLLTNVKDCSCCSLHHITI